jgi:hypothetical protein
VNIKWHWRHKESTLEELIAKNVEFTVPAPADQVDTLSDTDMAVFSERVREKRHIPQDVKDALEYCDGYHRGNTKRIRAYIEEILNGTP